MEQLKRKCVAELKPNAVVAACRFPLPNVPHYSVVGEGIDKVWLYNLQQLKK